MFSSPAILHRQLLLMASKSHRLHRIAETTTQGAMKKPRTITAESSSPSSAMKDSFSKYAEYLNQFNDKRERVVKASRDITINSKKVIFQLQVEPVDALFLASNLPLLGAHHKAISKENKADVLEKAEKDLSAVRDLHISRLVKELQGTDFWKLRRSYSPGVQEYVEAATLCKFCTSGTLLNLDEINLSLLPLSDPSVEPLQINTLDYLLGLADLTGELMRLAIGRVSDGELECAEKIRRFVREIYRQLTVVAPKMDETSDMKMKMDTMLQSVMKIENACFSVHVRGSEYIPLVGTDDASYALMGVPNFD